jgi:hypothetical protein
LSKESEFQSGIQNEADRIEESATFAQQGNLEAAKLWTTLSWILGSIIAGGSAVGGVLTFASAELQTLAGGLALLAAATTGVHGTLRPSKRAERARTVAALFARVQDDARRLRTIDAPASHDDAAIRDRLDEIASAQAAARELADPTPRWAYLLAKRNIEKERGQTHRVDAA